MTEVNKLKDHLKYHLSIEKIFLYWTWYFLFCSVVYIILSSILMTYISRKLMKPITDLTEIVKSSTKQVQAMKSHDASEANLTMNLATNFKKANSEMN